MAAITDLTFEQLIAQSESDSELFFVGEDVNGNLGVLISLSALNAESVADLTSSGVIKMMSRLISLCRKAQAEANQNQPVGEKLNAFPDPVSSGTITNGYVEITDAIKSRIVVASATQIEGSTV